MRRRLALVMAAALVVGGGAIASLTAVSSAAPATTIKVVEHATSDKQFDIGKKGDSSGDVLTFANKVYDETDATVVGRDLGACTRIKPKQGSWECSWTTVLEAGQITVEGPFYDTEDSVLAVTGGTGAYASATGSMDLHCYTGDDGVARCDFTFNLA